MPPITHSDKGKNKGNGRDERLYRDTVKNLKPIVDGVGDCVEVDFYPRNVRRYAYEDGREILIRRTGTKLWSIWLKS